MRITKNNVYRATCKNVIVYEMYKINKVKKGVSMNCIKRTAALSVLIFLISGAVFGFEPVNTGDLLISYLENDNDLKTNAINAQKAQLSLKSTQISNGFDISLSTGNISIYVDESGTNFSVKPSVTASIPQASDLSIKASSEIKYSDNQMQLKDASISATVDIISTDSLSRKISLLKAQRNVIEAERKLQNQAINSEKAFYTELKALLNSTSSIINSQKTLYTNKIDFEKIKTQGYSTGSSTYRLAQTKVLSSEHDIEKSTRTLIHDYLVFYKKCGYDISLDESTDFYDLIPQDITEVIPLDIHSYEPETYTEIESAVWTNKINTMQRQTKTNFALGVGGGVTFNNSTSGSTTIDTSVGTTFGGLTVNTGVSFPIGTSSSPIFSLSASVSPNTFRQNSITKQSDELDEKQELLSIENAYTSYATKVIDFEQSLADLQWTQQTDKETYEMYVALEKDLSKWFKDGFVTESEYLSAKVNAQSYYVKQIINSIEFIIYNDNIVTMFVNDSQE